MEIHVGMRRLVTTTTTITDITITITTVHPSITLMTSLSAMNTTATPTNAKAALRGTVATTEAMPTQTQNILSRRRRSCEAVREREDRT